MAPSIIGSLWTVVINPTTPVCALLLFISLVLFFRLGKRRRPVGSLPPSPRGLPLIGNLHQVTATPHEGLHALSLKYGPLLFMRFGAIPHFVISSGELVREVVKTHDAIFTYRTTTKASRVLFSESEDLLCSPQNKFWRLTRKLCVNELLSNKMVKSFQFIREEEVGRLVKTIGSSCINNIGSEIDLSKLFVKLAGSLVSRAVLGLKSAEEGGRESDEKMGKLAMEAVHIITDLFSFEDYIPALAWVDHLTGLNRKLKKTSRAINEFLDRVIDEHEMFNNGGEEGNDSQNDRKCFVRVILDLRKKDMMGLELTRGNIRSILLDMFLAGIGSSASSTEWNMAELARNPRIMKKVQEEVRSVVGEKSKIDESDIDQMKYLKCVIKESLRLHGPTVTIREASTTASIGGFKLPDKTIALINIWAIHRDPNTWERPLEFLPERFLDTSYNFTGQDQVYFPFGLGRRVCPGVQFAMSEIEYALANLLCWFDWELPKGMAPEDLDMRGTSSIAAHKIVPLCLVPVSVKVSAPHR
uniref:Cytochrome P450 n=1 Tax=Kalanchoe fedtschenkoi TaxID=63787 RepID=A0A7N0UZ94_KALFE